VTELSIQRGVLSIQGAPLYYEIAGSGQPLLLLHAGVADSRMWDEHFSEFARSYRVIRYDQRGFGQSEIPARRFAYYEDAHEILTHFACKRTHIVGISFGSKVALDFALAYPELVSSLVLVSPSIGGRKPTADILQFNQQEEELLARGDLASAAELNVRMWVDGPRRSPEQVEAAVRQRIYDMQYYSLRRVNVCTNCMFPHLLLPVISM
jgi:3-oxoadipate enol-lactonase